MVEALSWFVKLMELWILKKVPSVFAHVFKNHCTMFLAKYKRTRLKTFAQYQEIIPNVITTYWSVESVTVNKNLSFFALTNSHLMLKLKVKSFVYLGFWMFRCQPYYLPKESRRVLATFHFLRCKMKALCCMVKWILRAESWYFRGTQTPQINLLANSKSLTQVVKSFP